MKPLFRMLIVILMLCSLLTVAQAHDVPQERNDCSIEIRIRYAGENIPGGTLTAVKVGYVDEEDGNYFFSRMYDDLRLEAVDTPEAAAELLEYYEANRYAFEFEGQTVSVEDGIARFTELSTGLYLMIQEEAAEGFSPLNAFLIGVPAMKDGEYQYHVTSSMKTELQRETEPTTPPPTQPDDPSLPETGGLKWPIPLLMMSGLTLCAAGWLVRFGKRTLD